MTLLLDYKGTKMAYQSECKVTVTMGDGCVSIHRSGKSTITVANVLGKLVGSGEEHIYLDRLVHQPHETELGEFGVNGAISSILTRKLRQDANV